MGDLSGIPYDDIHFGEIQFQLSQGDCLLLYTDGLIENVGPDSKALSLRVVKKQLQSYKNNDQLKRDLLAAGRSVWQDQPADDDCSFIIVEWDQNSHSPSKVS